MHSWLFRHRARLRVLYGLAPQAELARPVEERAAPAREDAAPATSAGPRRMRTRKNRLSPGTLARRGRWVLFAPMPRRVG